MTTAIQSNPGSIGARHPHALVPTDTQKGADPLALDPATVVKLSQAQVFMDNVRRAWAKQSQVAMRYTAQLNASQQQSAAMAAQLGLSAVPSTLMPQGSEVACHPEMQELLKKHREREGQLSGELDAAIDDAQRPNMELLRVLGFLDFSDTRDTRETDQTREQRPTGDGPPPIDPATKDATGLIWDSHAEFYDQIGVLLSALKQNWLSKYQDAMKKFLEFYQEFSDIMENIKVDGVGDKGDVRVDFSEVLSELKSLMSKYGLDENALAEFPSEEAAKAFVDSIGIPGLKVDGPGSDGLYRVKMSMDEVAQIAKSMDNSPFAPVFTWDSAKYNAWISAKDGNVEQIKHMSKVLGEKLSETTQQFDNIVKILSSTIDKITDADMSFINGL